MKKLVIATSVAVLGLMASGSASASEALAKENGCVTCHDATKKKMGPAVKDIAAKYKGKDGAVDSVVANIKAGKGHPESKASDANLKAIVGWMLK